MYHNYLLSVLIADNENGLDNHQANAYHSSKFRLLYLTEHTIHYHPSNLDYNQIAGPYF